MYRRMVHRNCSGTRGLVLGASRPGACLESSREVLHGGQRYPVDGCDPPYVRANEEGSLLPPLLKRHSHDVGETSGN